MPVRSSRGVRNPPTRLAPRLGETPLSEWLPLKRLVLISSFLRRVREDQVLTQLYWCITTSQINLLIIIFIGHLPIGCVQISWNLIKHYPGIPEYLRKLICHSLWQINLDVKDITILNQTYRNKIPNFVKLVGDLRVAILTNQIGLLYIIVWL